jgi:alternate signal-mediated exported protein
VVIGCRRGHPGLPHLEQQDMQNSIKAAVAAVAGGTLLLGGAGTLAFWTDTGTVGGTGLTGGKLDLGTPACGDWLLDGDVVIDADTRIVPGDDITRVCTFTVDAEGDHLAADFDVVEPTWSATNALTGQIATDAAYTLNGDPVDGAGIAIKDNDAIEVTVTATFTGASATNASQSLTATLQAITITAEQSHVA